MTYFRRRKSLFHGRKSVRPEGLEPPTLGSEDRCSIQLSYGRLFLFNKYLSRCSQPRYAMANDFRSVLRNSLRPIVGASRLAVKRACASVKIGHRVWTRDNRPRDSFGALHCRRPRVLAAWRIVRPSSLSRISINRGRLRYFSRMPASNVAHSAWRPRDFMIGCIFLRYPAADS